MIRCGNPIASQKRGSASLETDLHGENLWQKAGRNGGWLERVSDVASDVLRCFSKAGPIGLADLTADPAPQSLFRNRISEGGRGMGRSSRPHVFLTGRAIQNFHTKWAIKR